MCFIIYALLDMVQWANGASNAIPIASVFNLFGLWLGISLPLVIVGGSVGFKRDALSAPCAVQVAVRPVPEQRWYLRTPFVVPLAGILPFGAVFIELVFILSSLWQGRVYYVFGFLALVFLISVFTCAEIAIVIVYFQLCYEDHSWWWRSFMAPGSSALHLYLYDLLLCPHPQCHLSVRGSHLFWIHAHDHAVLRHCLGHHRLPLELCFRAENIRVDQSGLNSAPRSQGHTHI